MPWNLLGNFDLKQHWQFTAPSEGEIFRVSHQLTFDKETSVRGVIAQGFEDSQVNIFNPKLFSYREETEIFTFYFPLGLKQHSLCFKRLDVNDSQWLVNVEVFQSENSEDNLNNYLLARFGAEINQMSLFPLLFSGSTTPEDHHKKLPANKPTKIISANDSRTELRFYSTGHPILLTTGFDEANKPLATLVRMPPNYHHHDVITSAGMYKGDVWAVSEHETYLHAIEFSAK